MAQKTAEVPQVPSMAEFEDNPVGLSSYSGGKFSHSHARHAAVLQSAWRRQYRQASKGRIQTFFGFFFGGACCWLSLFWAWCFSCRCVWSGFFPISVSIERAATQEPTNFSSGSEETAFWHRPKNPDPFQVSTYSLSYWSAGYFVECFVMGQVVCSRWSPGATILWGVFKYLFCQPSSACPADRS